MTVAAILEQSIRTKRLAGRAPGTIAFYEWAAELAKARWGGWSAANLTDEHLDAAYLEMRATGRRQNRGKKGMEVTDQPMAARSVEAMHKTIKAAYALAINKGQVVVNPASLATPPASAESGRAHWWTPAEVGAFLAYVDGLGSDRPVPLGLVEALVDTGGRRGEALGLRWSDLDLEAGTAPIARQLSSHPDEGT